MEEEQEDLLTANKKLIQEKEELSNKLTEAKEVIEAIKNGNIDAVFVASDVLVSKTADQTYRMFIENMDEGVVTLHPDGTILFSNSSFARMVNLPLLQVVGKNLRDFIPVMLKERFEVFFNEYRTVNPKLELSISNQSGTTSHFILSLNEIQLHESLSLNLVWTDITAQKMVEETLRITNKNLENAIHERQLSEEKVVELNKILTENNQTLVNANNRLSAFAHIASHDLQEPLRKIITYSSLLSRDYHDKIDVQGQHHLHTMQSASDRMQHLIRDLLEYSELSRVILFKPTSLQSVVNEILSNLEILIEETKASIICEKELPVIDANFSQMRQLFQNIIGNSLKFKKADRLPEISISYQMVIGRDLNIADVGRSGDNYCSIHVRDNGIGFDEAYKTKIFTIFQRLHSNSVYTGTGIGLAICKKIVEQHQGFITAESHPGEGSLFTITLPVKQQYEQTDAQ